MWFGLVDRETGRLLSVGTVEMFEGGDRAKAEALGDVVEFGPDEPDFAAVSWDPATRSLVDRGWDRAADRARKLAAKGAR